jgi:hypothetical protein
MSFKEEMLADGSWPPSSNEMPSLDDYPAAQLLRFVAASSFEGSGWLTPAEHALSANLARLADKAVREYRAASDCLTAFVEARHSWEPSFLAPEESMSVEGQTQLLRAADHIENCIEAVRRAEGFFDTAAFKAVTTPEQQAMLRDLHREVHDMRNAIQHAEERLEFGKVPPGEPVFIAVTTHGVYFAGEHVLYGELAALVMMLWMAAEVGIQAALAEVSPPADAVHSESESMGGK